MNFRSAPPNSWAAPVEASQFDSETIDIVSEFTMTSPERIWALISATRYVVTNKIAGDFVECGVWRGGSVLAICRTLKDLGVNDRKIYLYDTFEGMTPPTKEDMVIYSGASALELLENTEVGDGKNVWAYASLEDVKHNLKQSKYPEENFIFIKGDITQTLYETSPSQVSLLRLDTDWYASTKVELEILYPVLNSGGVLIIDDYGHWAGSKKAVDEYFDSINLRPLLNYVDYTGRLGVKI